MMGAVGEPELAREVRRCFRRLAERDAFAREEESNGAGIFVAKNGWRRPVMRLDARIWGAIKARDLVTMSPAGATRANPDGTVWTPSEAGLAFYRRLCADLDPFRAQHGVVEPARQEGAGTTAFARIDRAESPLAWLRSRKGSDGQPMIGEHQFLAGERLRADFTYARMEGRVTMDWDLALAPAGRTRKRAAPGHGDGALAAQDRLRKAISAVGPGLGDILIDVCCLLRGLEEVERRRGWPQRSAKVVLQIALDRLAVHYGLAMADDLAVVGADMAGARRSKQRASEG